MGANASKQQQQRYVGSNLRFPQLQKDLKRIFRKQNPNSTMADRRVFVNSLTNETRIRTVIEQFEIQVFGQKGGGNDFLARTDALMRQLKLK
jgi:hypothetical protein